MSPVLSIAASGLQHESNRLAVTANNVANLQTDGFAPRRVLGVEAPGGGVQSVVSLQASLAGLDGNLGVNNIDLVAESVSMITSVRAFEANAAVIRTEHKMVGSFLDRVI